MENQVNVKLQCEVVTREFLLVGECKTANFPSSFPDIALQTQIQFANRKHEISNALNQEILFSPYMCNGIVATYFACLEVESLTDIPEGMIGFKLPIIDYAKVRCTTKSIGEGYDQIFGWMQANGYRQKFLEQTCPVEIYYLEENVEEEQVEILIPIHSV